jgi:hypothetical protein
VAIDGVQRTTVDKDTTAADLHIRGQSVGDKPVPKLLVLDIIVMGGPFRAPPYRPRASGVRSLRADPPRQPEPRAGSGRHQDDGKNVCSSLAGEALYH